MTPDLPSNATAEAIIAKDAETIAAAEDNTGGFMTKVAGFDLMDPLNYVPNRNNHSLIHEVKVEIVSAAGTLNDVFASY